MKKLFTILFAFALISNASTFAQDQDDFDSNVEEDNSKTITGGFGADLAKKVSFVNFNGYITNEYFIPQIGTPTFDNHYFNIFVSSQLTDKIFIEGQLEYEHAGKDIDLRYAYADYKVSNALVFRTGKFLVPAGQFNEYLYPEYLSKTVNRPWVNREISPSAWAEVGLQLRGRLETSGDIKPFYAAYLVNGLSGESGSGIRGLRGNDRDTKGEGNANKAVGGAVGIDVGDDITLSANYYTGKYTADNELNLSIFGFSFYMNKEKFSIWSELHAANQEAYNDIDNTALGITDLNKNGFYVQGGYMVTDKLEPIIRYDQINLDGSPDDDRNRFTLGLNYYITETAVVKANYEIIGDDGANLEDNLLGFQLSIGF